MWENYNGSEIRVAKSVWRSQAEEPKRPKSNGAIPVIAPLRALLDSTGTGPDVAVRGTGSFFRMNLATR